MIRLRAHELPSNSMTKAVDYCLERREGLSRFLADARIEIDWNLLENAIRPCALCRRNWLFIEHTEAGDRVAVFYNLMASCRGHGINPLEYLKDIFTRVPAGRITEVESFTPAQWARRRV